MNFRTLSFTSLVLTVPFFAQAGLVAGSDIVGPLVTDELTRKDTSAVTDFRGTFDALRDLRSGKAASALVFIPDGAKTPEVESGEWVAAPVAYQPIYVAVHRANKAGEIDLTTLAGLYGKTTDTRFDTWRCLPASGLTQGPLALAPHPGKGLTVSHFRSEVLAGGEYRQGIRFASDDADAESRAVSTVNAIVLLSRAPNSGNLKVLAVADGRAGRTTKAYVPNASNLRSGDYPLRVTLFAVYPKKSREEARASVRIMLSDPVAKVLSENGMIPVAENIRNKFTQSLDN